MAKKKSPRKRPPVPMTASKALSRLAEPEAREPRDGERSSRNSGVFEELYASELRKRAEALAADVQDATAEESPAIAETLHFPLPLPLPLPLLQPKEAESGPKLTARAAREGTRGAAHEDASALARRQELEDDTSIPPVDVEAEQFFAQGESHASMPHLWGVDEHEELIEHAPHSDHVRRASPEVLARRARLLKVTQRVVGAFALIALVGLGKAAFTRAPSAELPLSSAVAHAAAALPHEEKAAQPVVQEAPRAPAAEAARAAAIPPPEALPAPSPEPVAAAAPPAAEPTKPADLQPADAKPAEAAPATAPSTDAKADKRAAQRAIDRGDNKGAVEAGERAIAADPDAETYLIVGAAYQQMGQGGKARQVFSACVSKATHGPRGECAALR